MKEMSRIGALQHDLLQWMLMGETWRSPNLQNVEQSCQSTAEAFDYA